MASFVPALSGFPAAWPLAAEPSAASPVATPQQQLGASTAQPSTGGASPVLGLAVAGAAFAASTAVSKSRRS
eukprot:CAMPEP_0204219016 /NCGR_PEP_ID=MMETSP0361-20130328/80012_1 /ASSEMBLY_ACC=CAM_ASM_000343 /TAXON_ID=268821 /ORGANISM="Scrippsiella Hangoei, Strain SHTV-5" /LENGTH=71 /DNA_ID=CAMNT_0051184247 /DNA_START=54 /DNA_END=266 /DNA_ORIENTATION=+